MHYFKSLVKNSIIGKILTMYSILEISICSFFHNSKLPLNICFQFNTGLRICFKNKLM